MRSEEEIRGEIRRVKKKFPNTVLSHEQGNLKALYLETLRWVLNDKGEK